MSLSTAFTSYFEKMKPLIFHFVSGKVSPYPHLKQNKTKQKNPTIRERKMQK
jgi:hypothetical protein